MPKMLAAQFESLNGPLKLVEKEIPNPTAGTVRIKIQACGVCHSDSFTQRKAFSRMKYPKIPGHEIAGVIDAVGPGVTAWKIGQRVGVGWNGGYCGHCESCRRGDFITCTNLQTPGIDYDGGYAEYTVAPIEALASIPEELSAVEAAPLLCAGITTFNALRNCGARPGDLVGILGIGGLGHLAVQFATKMGYKTVAIARGEEKKDLALKLGAHEYINSEAGSPAEALIKMGGAKVILTTVTSASAIKSTLEGLGTNGKLLIVGAAEEPLSFAPLFLIRKRFTIAGWPSGAPIDSQDTMSFCKLTGIRSMSEMFPLKQAPEAYERMMSGKARFRVVINP
jgi:D-arabinose 1-dehydrogenase-like Zn-dependent alcohol dehydrogenase